MVPLIGNGVSMTWLNNGSAGGSPGSRREGKMRSCGHFRVLSATRRCGSANIRLVAFLMVTAWFCTAMAAERAPLTSLRTIHTLSNDQAGQGLPVAFEATVTYFRS